MPDDTRAIEPALTPEEWKTPWGGMHSARGVDQEFWLHLLGEEGNAKWLSIRLDGRVWNLREPRSFAAIMAFANAALPDDDPRKITREDVTWLRQLAESADIEPGWGGDAVEMRALAAKLAALLPPEG